MDGVETESVAELSNDAAWVEKMYLVDDVETAGLFQEAIIDICSLVDHAEHRAPGPQNAFEETLEQTVFLTTTPLPDATEQHIYIERVMHIGVCNFTKARPEALT
jgi:hypothetical protein